MRHVSTAAAVVGLLAAPLTAKADWIVAGSAGKGYQLRPSPGVVDTNLMLTAGYGFGEYIRLELGAVADLGDVENSKFDVKIRPMLVLAPPLIPIHARVVVGMANILNDATFEFGGAIGLSGSLFGLGVFVEAGLLPQNQSGTLVWIAETRAGVYYVFD
ncbi:MAG: hypothetical protein V3T05_07410 [Myxococcota bacterium]